MLVRSLAILILAAAATTTFAGDRLPLKQIDAICYPAEREADYGQLAYALRAYLRALFEVNVTLEKSPPREGSVAIVLGRDMAESCGLVSAAELNAVRVDGFVLRVTDRAVALAGFEPQGTHYAVWRMLRMAGAGVFPGAFIPPVDPAAASLPITTLAEKPFFEFRDCRGDLDRGVCGTTLRQYTLGSAKEAAEEEGLSYEGWLGWDHTAGYLVPTSMYAGKHPEYFAQQLDGTRTPLKSASTVTLCTSNPAVRSILADRAMRWMTMQDRRRFFAITEGDATPCLCDACRALDHHPYYTVDRTLSWVNYVARAAASQHPAKKLLTFAYIRDVKPPVQVKPEPNVIVMYAPWVWSSRATSAVDWAHPLNTTAMEEFLAWEAIAPGQIGVYDYVYGNWTTGTASRIKFWARHNARWVYMNAPPKDPLFVWVCAQLLWDPFQDVETLTAEFVEGYYGPAAAPMAAYHALRERAIQRDMIHDMSAWGVDPSFGREAAALLDAAEQAVQQHDEKTQQRIGKVIETARKELAQRAALVTNEPEAHDVVVSFNSADETARWLTDGSEAIFEPVEAIAEGVRVSLPLSRLPVAPNSLGKPIHVGTLYAERRFDPPVDVSGCVFVEFRVKAAAPVRCVVQVHGAKRAFDLHRGQQIIRMDISQFDSSPYFDPATWDHRVSEVSFQFMPITRDEARDSAVAFIGMRWTNQLPAADRLPHPGEVVWLSQFRPNMMTPGLVTGAEAPDVLYTTRGEAFTHPTDARWKAYHGGRIKFRSFLPHAALSPISAIEYNPGAEPAAKLLQRAIERLFHVRLPLREAADGVNCITLDATDDGGAFTIDIRDGRAVIRGDVMRGVKRYLYDYGVVVDPRGRMSAPPLHAGHRGMLHELYVVEKPWFVSDMVTWRDGEVDEEAVRKVAALIKAAAGRGDAQPPVVAATSPAAAYVIDALLWNPLADTSRLLRDAGRAFEDESP